MREGGNEGGREGGRDTFIPHFFQIWKQKLKNRKRKEMKELIKRGTLKAKEIKIIKRGKAMRRKEMARTRK